MVSEHLGSDSDPPIGSGRKGVLHSMPPGTVLIEAVSIDVRPSETTNAPKREALAIVLETDNSEVGEHLSDVEVGLDNEPNSSARITEEINELVVYGGN